VPAGTAPIASAEGSGERRSFHSTTARSVPVASRAFGGISARASALRDGWAGREGKGSVGSFSSREVGSDRDGAAVAARLGGGSDAAVLAFELGLTAVGAVVRPT